jgi:AI-2 transport protein TqsA
MSLFPGAFIGVPILIAFIIDCEKSSVAKWIAVLLSAKAFDNSDRTSI